MPPSTVMRFSSAREHRMENAHKRGRSFESGLPLKNKDDDLALFKDMQNGERDNFLLHTSYDFEDSISKLRDSSDFKLGITTIPVRRESSDLLNVDAGKNDYDWLLTPPDTPLFPSLDDDDVPEPAKPSHRGRPRAQPIPISRSSMTDRMNKTSRSSASPHRLSPSTRSSYTVSQSKGRSSSAPRSSQSPALRPITPTRRPSTPPNKTSSPTTRSSTPMLRRSNSGSSWQSSSSGKRGASPVKTTRRNSASPELRGWQLNLSFSSDVPPNLRTSPSDHPASHRRGLSPASRNSSSNSRRQSMSPTACRRANLSHSREQDHLSSHSRGSVASSGDDDFDSQQSVAIGISVSPTARKYGVLGNSRAMAFSKKPFSTLSASSAHKRSFDSSLQQMENHKIPQNMFRPLLSSAPATMLYVEEADNSHHAMITKNSSHMHTKNASSEQTTSIAHHIISNNCHQNDLASGWRKMQDLDCQEEAFISDKVHEMVDDLGQCRYENFNRAFPAKLNSEEFEKSTSNLGNAVSIKTASESSYIAGYHSEVHCHGMMVCFTCGKKFSIVEVGGKTDVCKECARKKYFSIGLTETTTPMTLNKALQSDMPPRTDQLCSKLQLKMETSELSEKNIGQAVLNHQETDNEQGPDCIPDSFPLQFVLDERKKDPSEQKSHDQLEVDATRCQESKFNRSQDGPHQSLMIDDLDGQGASVLVLQRSNSNKLDDVRGRLFSARNIICSNPSCVSENTSAMLCSNERDSSSASSVDLGSSGQTEAYVQQQFSSQKGERENLRSGYDAKALNTGPSLSSVKINSHEALVPTKNKAEEKFCSSAGSLECEALGDTMLVTENHGDSLETTELPVNQSPSFRQLPHDGGLSVHAECCKDVDASSSKLLSHPQSNYLHGIPTVDYSNDEDCVSCVSDENIQENHRRITDKEKSVGIPESSIIEEDYRKSNICEIDHNDAPRHSSGNRNMGLENDRGCLQTSQMECTDSYNTRVLEASCEYSVSTMSEKDVLALALDSSIINHAHGVYEKSAVCTVEDPREHIEELTVIKHENQRGQISRSLTLEEATDTILFCSSIVHDLAYKAVTIGMENELMLSEASRPTVTFLGKSVRDQRDLQKIYSRCTPKSRRAKERRMKGDAFAPTLDLANNASIQESTLVNYEVTNKVNSMKPPELESKCNCAIM
ncbi:uncharacterized protein [Elaeis guineensis]|uniref:Uncharacterized protein LOC105048830 n=1 Tax=Elaeis guineensis var. tenera TaxID=51953 RepID=A0A6I9RI12_ELAGV|nr:uncharacterized protein LOC105048830 [Elaeis guineensis]